MADDEKWYGTFLKYVALPLVAIGALYFIIQAIFQGSKAIDTIAYHIATVWGSYNDERKEYMTNDGTIDPNEKALLDEKLKIIEEGQDSIGNAILDPNQAINTLIGVAAIIVGFYITFQTARGMLADSRQAKHAENLKKQFLDMQSGETIVSTAIPEIFGLNMDINAAMAIADTGNVTLAANSLNEIQSRYFTQTLPQMTASYNALAAQLPNLIGVQLAVAQFMITQYSVYLTYYVSTPPVWMTPIVLPPI